jgi:hypothetical protein
MRRSFIQKMLALMTSLAIVTSGGASVPQESVDIWTLKNDKFAGDTDQLRGVSAAFVKWCGHKKVVCENKEVDMQDVATLPQALEASQAQNKVVFFVGPYGAEALLTLKKDSKTPFIAVHLSHQKLDVHDKIFKTAANSNGADFIALPQHVLTIDPDLEKALRASQTQLIATTGVCQGLTKDQLKKDYDAFKTQLPGGDDPQTPYLVFVLPGDSQSANGTDWLLASSDQANELAVQLATRAKENGQQLLILNGPRTGKFQKKGEEDKQAHREGVMDHLTASVKQTLDDKGLTYTLYDFQFGKPSAWAPVLYVLKTHPGSSLYLEGTSTSMISQALAHLSGVSVVLYQHDGMNDAHYAHLKTEQEGGRAAILTLDGKLKEAAKLSENHPFASTAEDTVAQAVFDHAMVEK